jgi:hypothetical protein
MYIAYVSSVINLIYNKKHCFIKIKLARSNSILSKLVKLTFISLYYKITIMIVSDDGK